MAKVIVHLDDTVARVELNRPDKHNGVDLDLIDELIEAADRLAADRDVRAVVIHGAGPSFCAGLDIKSVMGDRKRAAGAVLALLKPTMNRFQRFSLAWRELSVPVVAAIHGNCFGAGLQLALGADIRICRPDAKLSLMEGKWGLIPDMGGTVLLRELVAVDVALDLAFSARQIAGEEAARIGLVTRLSDDPIATATELAKEYANRSPDSAAAAKQLFHEAWQASQSRALAAERKWQLRMLRTRNQRIATKRNTTAPDTPFERRRY